MTRTTSKLSPSAKLRKELQRRGGETANRCYQCATCSAVCNLAPPGAPFPRRQMLAAQWGLEERLVSDPALWLCHQCEDCTVRCPRDAKPGDVMQTLRSISVERLSTPRFMGTLLGNVALTWPVVIGLPILFWAAFIYAVNGLNIPKNLHAFDQFVPHWMIYIVNIPIFALVVLMVAISALRAWSLWGDGVERKGSFISNLIPVLLEIATNKRLGQCDTARPRRTGHLLLMWGFVGALITTTLVAGAIHLLGAKLPYPMDHPFKILGNISAVLLVLGGLWLLINRLSETGRAGASTAFDNFFLFIVLTVVVTGVLTELGRLYFDPGSACTLYIIHLGTVLCLFYTFPYSKFAHLVYRTLAMVHERMTLTK